MNWIKKTIILLLVTIPLLMAITHLQSKPLVGIHGMAVFKHQQQWYASHMPLANSIHAHQLIFSIKTDAKLASILEDVANDGLITLMPEKFDLRMLMNGELNQFRADLFHGHFERGGNSKGNLVISVDKIMLNHHINGSGTGEYFVIPTSTQSGFLVHQITNSTSFDQIIQYDNHSNSSNKTMEGNTSFSNTEPLKLPIKQLKPFHRLKQLYLETSDFQ
ncbi:MAG: hypothetical protein KUG78_06990 [Kangiellaceae bacterium]|nr:hypothetical protein [Kangiellaceae bacterium]